MLAREIDLSGRIIFCWVEVYKWHLESLVCKNYQTKIFWDRLYQETRFSKGKSSGQSHSMLSVWLSLGSWQRKRLVWFCCRMRIFISKDHLHVWWLQRNEHWKLGTLCGNSSKASTILSSIWKCSIRRWIVRWSEKFYTWRFR